MISATSWDTVKRIGRNDPVLDAMRDQLHRDLVPETYNPVGAAIQQRKIAKYLEARNHTERVHRAANAVAGLTPQGYEREAA